MRWDADLVNRWRDVPTAIIADVSEGRCLIDPKIRPLRPAGQQPRLFGFAITAHCMPPDFGAVLRALEEMRAGKVLVIAAQAHADNAMIGGILGGYLHRKNAQGVVCDGAIRDVAELAGFNGFSVYARHITPRGPMGAARGSVNIEVMIGARVVSPDDLIIGDDDGLVCLSQTEATALIEKAEAKLRLEDDWQRRLKSGENVKSVFGL
jgi:4-hydroxy-4-methyl-2-oxoglutarate aldolase